MDTDPDCYALRWDGQRNGCEATDQWGCGACGSKHTPRLGTPMYRLKTASERVARATHLAMKGTSGANISEVMGHSPSTITRWLERDGQHSERLHEQRFKGLTIVHIQVDELVSRVRQLKQVYTKMLCGERSVLRTVLQSVGLSGSIQTAYVKRLNLTICHTVAALRRRTWALAHSVRSLRWRVALRATYYNFCRTHHALRMEVGQGRYRQRTPAMALGVTGQVWSVKEFITHPVY